MPPKKSDEAPATPSRKEMLVAQQDIRHTDAAGNERVVLAGEKVSKDDPLVALHPFQFAPPEGD